MRRGAAQRRKPALRRLFRRRGSGVPLFRVESGKRGEAGCGLRRSGFFPFFTPLPSYLAWSSKLLQPVKFLDRLSFLFLHLLFFVFSTSTGRLSMYDNSRNRGLAFITMASEEDTLLALNNLNSYDLNGRVIKVEFARSLKKKPGLETIAPTTFNVFVGNLAWRVRSRDLRELFGNAGKLVSAEVIFQSNPRRSAGYGFVSYATKEEAEAAIAAHNEKRLMGRKIRLILGKPQVYKSEEQYSGDILSFEASGQSNPQGEIPFQTDDRLDLA